MNHKRKRPKNQRAGCLLCKPHKHQAEKDTLGNQTLQEKKGRIAETEQKVPANVRSVHEVL